MVHCPFQCQYYYDVLGQVINIYNDIVYSIKWWSTSNSSVLIIDTLG
jgi:hypothetical protein